MNVSTDGRWNVRWDEQGTIDNARHTVVPRTLCFLVHDKEVLLLRGAPGKRLWAGKLNGVGGHVEPGEGLLDSARREVREETGLAVHDLDLRAVVHISGGKAAPGVLLFVFIGQAPSRKVRAGREGELSWYRVDALPSSEMVEDLVPLLPRMLGHRGTHGLIYGNYVTNESGLMEFCFAEG